MVGDPTELLMLLETSTAKLRLKVKAGGWGWRGGMEVFIAPETRCSFCNEVFETNRVYLVDNIHRLVPKQWRLATGEAVRIGNKMYHPHAFHLNGRACMNMAGGMAQLLFNSISVHPSYNAQSYFWDVGHTCPKVANSKCLFCEKKVPGFALVHRYGEKFLCSKTCVDGAQEKLCFGCFKEHKGQTFTSKYGLGPYCKKCWTKQAKLEEK